MPRIAIGTVVVAGLLVAAAGCREPSEGEAPAPSRLDLSAWTIVDLSHPYDEDTLYWPTSPSRFELAELAYGPTEAGYFYSAYSFCTPEHGGTHIDAPVHFAEGGLTVGRIPVDRLVAPAVVLDVREAASADPDYRVGTAEIERWEASHGTIPEGAIVLLRTGWARFWPNARDYLGDDTPGDASNLHFPSYGVEAARLLVEERRVAGLGVDTASIDDGASTDFPVHRLAAAAGVFGLENVADLDAVPPTGAWLVALPMKIARGSGGPVRIVALVPPGSAGSGQSPRAAPSRPVE